MVAATHQEVEAFRSFALERLNNSSTALTLDDLLMEWESIRNREDINTVIREGIKDVNAGRYRPAKDVMSELAAKYGLTSQ